MYDFRCVCRAPCGWWRLPSAATGIVFSSVPTVIARLTGGQGIFSLTAAPEKFVGGTLASALNMLLPYLIRMKDEGSLVQTYT